MFKHLGTPEYVFKMTLAADAHPQTMRLGAAVHWILEQHWFELRSRRGLR